MGQKSLRIFLSLSGLVSLVACGGSTVSPVTNPTPAPILDPIGLSDPSITTAQAVTVLDASGTQVGSFTPSDAEALVSGSTIAVLEPSVNLGLSDVSVLNGETIAFVAPTGTAPTGTVFYNGAGLLIVNDVPTASLYEGTADVELRIRFDGVATSTLEFTNFDGLVIEGFNAAEATSGQSLTIGGISATAASGLSGGSSVSSYTFGDADFTGATFVIDGAFAGENYDELGGIIDVDAAASDGSSIQAGFGATR